MISRTLSTWIIAGSMVPTCIAVQDAPSLGPSDASKPMTVDGPESKALRDGVRGVLVVAEPLGALTATAFPAGKSSSIRAGKREQPIVSDVSGPDSAGRLLVVLSTSPDAALALLAMDGENGGPPREIVRGKDGPGFKFTFAGPSLSPTGRHALVIRDPRSVYMKVEPNTTFREGRVEIWDVETGKALDLTMTGLVDSASWFPDGASLGLCALISPQELPKGAIEAWQEKALGKQSSVVPLAEMRVPALFRIEHATGRKELLQIGRRCLIAGDGRSLLVQGIGTEWMRRDVAAGTFERVDWPGAFHGPDHPVQRLLTYPGGPIAFDGDLVIYWGLPTTGAPLAVTDNNSPLVGEKPMLTIKAARLSTGEFATLVPEIDPRRDVTFGARQER